MISFFRLFPNERIVNGPRRPKNIVTMMMICPARDNSPVTPIERPTVAKAEMTSNSNP